MALEKGDGKDSIYTNLTVQPAEESDFLENCMEFCNFTFDFEWCDIRFDIKIVTACAVEINNCFFRENKYLLPIWINYGGEKKKVGLTKGQFRLLDMYEWSLDNFN